MQKRKLTLNFLYMGLVLWNLMSIQGNLKNTYKISNLTRLSSLKYNSPTSVLITLFNTLKHLLWGKLLLSEIHKDNVNNFEYKIILYRKSVPNKVKELTTNLENMTKQ